MLIHSGVCSNFDPGAVLLLEVLISLLKRTPSFWFLRVKISLILMGSTEPGFLSLHYCLDFLDLRLNFWYISILCFRSSAITFVAFWVLYHLGFVSQCRLDVDRVVLCKWLEWIGVKGLPPFPPTLLEATLNKKMWKYEVINHQIIESLISFSCQFSM